MEGNSFTFRPIEINKIREMFSGDVDDSTINQVMMIVKSRCHEMKLISVSDLRELICDELSQKQLTNVMQTIKSYQY